MELKFIKEKKIHDIAIIRKFSYGPYEMTVTIDLDGPIEIVATDKYQEIVVNDEKAIISIECVYLSSSEDINDFAERCNTAAGLLELINNNRDTLIRKEELL